MKKFASLFTLALALALTGNAHAQDKMSGGKMSGGKMSGGKMAPAKAAPTQSLTGPIKGAPSGKTFTLGLKKGPVSVDATKAKVRVNGKFASLTSLTDGMTATVVGKMSGTSFMADTVTVKTAPAAKATPGGKMAPKGK